MAFRYLGEMTPAAKRMVETILGAHPAHGLSTQAIYQKAHEMFPVPGAPKAEQRAHRPSYEPPPWDHIPHPEHELYSVRYLKKTVLEELSSQGLIEKIQLRKAMVDHKAVTIITSKHDGLRETIPEPIVEDSEFRWRIIPEGPRRIPTKVLGSLTEEAKDPVQKELYLRGLPQFSPSPRFERVSESSPILSSVPRPAYGAGSAPRYTGGSQPPPSIRTSEPSAPVASPEPTRGRSIRGRRPVVSEPTLPEVQRRAGPPVEQETADWFNKFEQGPPSQRSFEQEEAPERETKPRPREYTRGRVDTSRATLGRFQKESQPDDLTAPLRLQKLRVKPVPWDEWPIKKPESVRVAVPDPKPVARKDRSKVRTPREFGSAPPSSWSDERRSSSASSIPKEKKKPYLNPERGATGRIKEFKLSDEEFAPYWEKAWDGERGTKSVGSGRRVEERDRPREYKEERRPREFDQRPPARREAERKRQTFSGREEGPRELGFESHRKPRDFDQHPPYQEERRSRDSNAGEREPRASNSDRPRRPREGTSSRGEKSEGWDRPPPPRKSTDSPSETPAWMQEYMHK